MILNLFSGADGWGVGAVMLGLHPVGVELNKHACATAKAAGHHVIRQDVTTFSAEHLCGRVEGLVASPPCTDFSAAGKRAGINGETGRLVFEPMRVARECEPEWIACEQVPAVLPIWQAWCVELRQHGYSTWTGILDAASYGAPQNRLRAILIASRARHVGPPPPTHAEHPQAPLFGEELEPWVSMADALGWGLTGRPAFVVCAKDSGGIELASGGAGQRNSLRREMAAERWRWNLSTGRHNYATNVPRSVDRPAPTFRFGHDINSWEWHLDTHRGQREDGSTQALEVDTPVPAVTGKASGQWAFERPTTTVQGDMRIARPGHTGTSPDKQWQFHNAIKVTLEELAVLQSFPRGYPWQGNKGQRALQIGNAIPPLLAAHVLSAASGIPLRQHMVPVLTWGA